MRRRAMLSLAIAGMFIIASAAVSGANWYHRSGSSEGSSSGMMSPAEEPGTETPQAGTYERQEPTEAGKLPSGEHATGSGSGFRTSEDIRTVEVGGSSVRLGIDSGP